jgi:phosphatidylinositol alpha-1,6-mannosyltransferase
LTAPPPHLLVTNDFPPKEGGIQTYLYELWASLPPTTFAVVTRAFANAEEFDARQPFRIYRVSQPVLSPTPALLRTIRVRAAQIGAKLVILDPLVPTGLCGLALARGGLPYGIVLHGAEAKVALSLPGLAPVSSRVLRRAKVVVAAGGYAMALASAATQASPTSLLNVPPPVDTERFRPALPGEKEALRRKWGVGEGDYVVLGVSRLVPRKGFDVLIKAAGAMREKHPRLRVLIAGRGRDRLRLGAIAASCSAGNVRFLGAVGQDDLPELYRVADVFAMICRDRWAGLEQEGFGIVFVEAQASGLPVIVGRSGGSPETLLEGETGYLVKDPRSVGEVAALIARLEDPEVRRRMGKKAREWAVSRFGRQAVAGVLAGGLAEALDRGGLAAELK